MRSQRVDLAYIGDQGSRIQKAAHLPCPMQMISSRFPAAHGNISAVFEEAVLELRLRRLLQPVEHAAHSRDIHAVPLGKILREQRFEKNKSAVAVRYRMKKFCCDPIFINQNTERTFADVPAAHTGERIAFFGQDSRRLRQLFKIVPKYARAQPHRDRRKPPHRHIQSGFENIRVDGFGKRRGKPEHIAPIPAPCRRIDFRRVVELHPAQLMGARQNRAQKFIELFIIACALFQIVQYISMPHIRCDDKLALRTGHDEFFMEKPCVVKHDFIPACEDKRPRHTGKLAEQRRDQRICAIRRIKRGIEIEPFLCQ